MLLQLVGILSKNSFGYLSITLFKITVDKLNVQFGIFYISSEIFMKSCRSVLYDVENYVPKNSSFLMYAKLLVIVIS